MLLAHKWAWEALLASDQANDATVEQIEKAISDALEDGEEVQPELRARVEIYWLKKATDTEQGLGPRVISALLKLKVLVDEHSNGASKFDDTMEFPDLLDPKLELALRVRSVIPACFRLQPSSRCLTNALSDALLFQCRSLEPLFTNQAFNRDT